MNKVFSIIFIGAVAFFSLWLKQPVKADYASCIADCSFPTEKAKIDKACQAECILTSVDEASYNDCFGFCAISKKTFCEGSCTPDAPKKKNSTTPAPSTPIIPPSSPSSAESEFSCAKALPSGCPALDTLGVTKKSAFLPDCVYYEGTGSANEKCCGCRNVNVLVDFLVKFSNWLFGIAGGAALIVFVYGGFVILTAAGGERVKKGKDIIVAAVIGLIIVFTAQVGLKFILSALLKPAPTETPSSAPATLEGLNIKVIETE